MRTPIRVLLAVLAVVLFAALGLAGAAGAEAPAVSRAEPNAVITDADEQRLEDDVFAKIDAVTTEAVRACGGPEAMTEAQYVSLIPQVVRAVEASETYVPGTLQQNGSFLVWETTVGLPCCYDPKMEAKLRSSAGETASTDALSDLLTVRGGQPSTAAAGLIQPYWESSTNYADSNFNSYSPKYLEAWQALNDYAQTTGLRYTLSNATIDNVARVMESCGVVIFDSHGNTDYTGTNGDRTSRANCSYLCLTTSVGITSNDTKAQTGPYGTYYHAVKGSSYTMVSGTCIANHMKTSAPHSLLYNGICLGMATDGIYKPLRAKGVETVWGYSQTVSFKGETRYMQEILAHVNEGDSFAAAVSKAKEKWGNWDPAYPDYTLEQCVQRHIAFPICVSGEDAYPGRGNLDAVQTVKSAWSRYSSSFTVSGKCGDNAAWTLTLVSGKLDITGSGAVYDNTQSCWAAYCSRVRTVSIGNGITALGQYAFLNASDLTAVTLGSGLQTIGREAFRGCIGLKTIRIPGSVGEIGLYAFYSCTGLTSLTLDNGVKTIGDDAFRACSGITELRLPDSLVSVGSRAFKNCSGLTGLTVGRGVKTYGSGAFDGCSALRQVNLSDLAGWCGSVFTNAAAQPLSQECRLYVNGTAVSELVIPAGVTKIGDYAFCQCRGLSSVYIPDSVSAIGYEAFYDCGQLKSVRIPAGVTGIGGKAFSRCGALADLYFACGKADMEALLAACAAASGTESQLADGLRTHYDAEDPATHWQLLEDEHSPTCTAAGDNTYGCACGYGYSVPAPALGHLWDEGLELQAPSLTQNGFVLYTCLRCGATETVEVSNNPFTDVKEGKYYYDAVLWALYHDPQITSGTDAAHFGPNKTCTRGQIMTFLWNALGRPEPESEDNPFEDVAEGKYYYKATLWAFYFNPQITGGTDDTHFSPNRDCTRAQVVTFLWKAMGAPEPALQENPFEDVPESKYYYKPVLWAVETGITSGVDETHFGPGKACTRAQVVTFLYKAFAE